MPEFVEPGEETVDAKYTEVSDDDKIPTETINPLRDNTEKKPYVNHSTLPPQEIPEPVFNQPPLTDTSINNVGSEHKDKPRENTPPKEEKKESTTSSSSSSSTSEPFRDGAAKPLSDADTEKTCDQLLDVYQQFFPKVFLFEKLPWSAKYNMGKMKTLHTQGKIDLNEIITTQQQDQQGNVVPVQMVMNQFFTQFNSSIETVFNVSDEEKKALREPLLEVMLENKIKLTPMQRLMAVLAIQTGQRAAACFAIGMQKKEDIDRFMKAHAEKMSILRGQQAVKGQPTTAQNNTQQEQNNQQEEVTEVEHLDQTPEPEAPKKPTLQDAIQVEIVQKKKRGRPATKK